MQGTDSELYDVCVIGGGIVGLATGLALLQARPRRLVILEAETTLSAHQTGHNSGVIHSGIYYRPGSLKAKLCTEGRTSLYRFCEEQDVPVERCGKLIVATTEQEIALLDELSRRSVANGVDGVRRVAHSEMREREPEVAGLAGLLVEATGIVSYPRVAEAMAGVIERMGGEIQVGSRVRRIDRSAEGFRLFIQHDEVRCANLVNCAGLHSDRVARMCGIASTIRIVPFRGEYLLLRSERRGLVRHLIYPVPDPALPFLGAHFTRGIDGKVELGPNAILALARHGYSGRQASVRDIAEMVMFPGFWRMSRRHWRMGVDEMARSLSVRHTVERARRLLPALVPDDVEPGHTGVRAQAVDESGKLLDDFALITAERMLHVLNAPSPAATASLAIGRHLAARTVEAFRAPTKVQVTRL